MARALAGAVRDGHGIGQAATLDMSEEVGAPRGFVGTRNLAIDRALGGPGIPLGRFTEVSGWPNAGKSTVLDQILAQCQAEGGLGVLADTERTRNRLYMTNLGVDPKSLVWIAGQSVEAMFAEVETLTRTYASHNAMAWYRALVRAGVKCPPPTMLKHEITEPGPVDKKGKKTWKVVHSFHFAKWGREQAAALMAWQKEAGFASPSAIRDAPSRERLRPCVLFGTDEDQRDAEAAWIKGDPHQCAQPADRPCIVGWDSVAGTPTEEELEGDARDVHVATAAKVIRRNLRRMVQLIDDEAIGWVLVNQRYEKIETGAIRSFGPKSETYGGGGIKYHTTIRIEVDKVGEIMARGAGEHDPPVGQIVRIRVPKNKVESPFHEEKFGLIFGRGADNAWAVHEDFRERGIINAHGGWSRFTDPALGDKSFRGWTELSEMCAADPALWDRLRRIYLGWRT